MSYEQTSLMASNSEQTNQSQTPPPQANMTPEQEHNTRVMACDIQRFYECVRRDKHVFRRWISHYEINLAKFLEPHCTLFKNERNWPETWLENERDLMNDLETFRRMAKQLLQQWTRAVAAQILSVRNTAISKLFTAEDFSLAVKLEPSPHWTAKLAPWTGHRVNSPLIRGMKGGPTMERPGHPWTRMKGFDVLNLMIKNAEDPVNEEDGEDMRDDLLS
ncbi:hypothetical protein DER44DRAFT_887369 [Fusarium oxysporum]|nr:hypothetical protein DER44DRAFT_887369 [Fusarium oxysporum]